MLIDEAIHGDRNVINKEADKILNYKDQLKEIQHVECESKSDISN